MKTLALEDLKGKSSKEVIEHLVANYAGSDTQLYREITSDETRDAKKKLRGKRVLIAYESVGDYGCDSSSFFLLQDKKTGKLFEVHGSHCSCYGFEGQLQLEETTVKALQMRAKAGSCFSTGGYDSGGWKDDTNSNQKEVNDYILKLNG